MRLVHGDRLQDGEFKVPVSSTTELGRTKNAVFGGTLLILPRYYFLRTYRFMDKNVHPKVKEM